jgi:hypothetical protein
LAVFEAGLADSADSADLGGLAGLEVVEADEEVNTLCMAVAGEFSAAKVRESPLETEQWDCWVLMP